jgi:hypothetical protein
MVARVAIAMLPSVIGGPRRQVVGMGRAMRQQRLAPFVFGPLHGDQTLI